jgi:hypothetical protein
VVDIYKELTQFDIDVDIYDSFANKKGSGFRVLNRADKYNK